MPHKEKTYAQDMFSIKTYKATRKAGIPYLSHYLSIGQLESKSSNNPTDGYHYED